MNEPSDHGAPGIIRQEGPHRVNVAPGSHAAMAPSGAEQGGKRLRPALGAAPLPTQADQGTAHDMEDTLRKRPGAGGSTTEIQHLPDRVAVNGRFAPGEASPAPAAPRAAPNALEQRMAALAELNSKTSRTVTAFESEVTPVAGTAAGHAPAPRRFSFFKRRSS